MDAAIPADAKSAPTGIWKTAQNAVSHSAHTRHRVLYEEDRRPKRTTLINLSTDSDQVQAILAIVLVVIPLVSAIGMMAMGASCCGGMMGMRGNMVGMSIAGVVWLAAAAISVIALIVFAIRGLTRT